MSCYVKAPFLDGLSYKRLLTTIDEGATECPFVVFWVGMAMACLSAFGVAGIQRASRDGDHLGDAVGRAYPYGAWVEKEYPYDVFLVMGSVCFVWSRDCVYVLRALLCASHRASVCHHSFHAFDRNHRGCLFL